jgi:hypothetical protein
MPKATADTDHSPRYLCNRSGPIISDVQDHEFLSQRILVCTEVVDSAERRVITDLGREYTYMWSRQLVVTNILHDFTVNSAKRGAGPASQRAWLIKTVPCFLN